MSRYNSARLTIGDVVLISDPSEGIGVVRHIDEISFIVGIELTDPLGTSDGIRNNERYFQCRPQYGIFVSVSDIVRLVSPEELLHKIVVLNRALAHKHSTLTTKNQIIDKLDKEIISLKQTLSINIVNQQNLSKEINKLKTQIEHTNIRQMNGKNKYKYRIKPKVRHAQTLNRESKPQTPHDTDSDEDDDDDDDDEYEHVDGHHIEQQKPQSRPPSRRGSFLSSYTHHLYGNETINREQILNRGRKLNDELVNYTFHKKKKKKKIKRNKHSRDISKEQLVFHHDIDEMQNHSHKEQKHRKQRSNVEEAAMKLMEEINATKEIMTTSEEEEEEEDDDDDDDVDDDNNDGLLLSDEYFVEMSDAYNNNHNGHKGKRWSRSQPTSPRHYYHNEFSNFNLIPKQNSDDVEINSYNNKAAPLTPTLNTSYSNAPSSRHQYSRTTANFQPNHRSSKQPLNATSVWRKNRQNFLKNMDKKLEEVMHRFEAKNNGNSSSQLTQRPISKFRSKPIVRKRGFSYNQNSFEKMKQIAAENAREQHSNSTNGNKNKKYEWLTTKTTFSKYNDRLSKNEEENEHNDDSQETETKPSNFKMVPRRSLSLPSSPKHSTNVIDKLDLGDDEAADDDADDDESDDDEHEHEHDVLEDDQDEDDDDDNDDDSHSSQTEHISDESSCDNNEDEEEETHYERSIQRRRRRQRFKRRNRYNASLSSDDSDVDSDDEDNNGDVVDLDQEQYKYYQRKKRNSKIHLLDKDEFEKEYNSILQ